MPTPFTYSSIGVSGYSGYSGYSGQVGASAASGYSGISGYSGTSGYSGVSGYSGAFAGTGTSGYIPRFTGASSLGNSLIQDNGSTVTVNASTLVQGVLSTLSTNGVNVFESAGISSVGLQFRTNSTNRFKIETPSASNDLAFYYGGTTEVGRFSSTGLAVTGSVSGSAPSAGATTFTATSNGVTGINHPLYTFQRFGGAVAGEITYEGVGATMNMWTTTAHNLVLGYNRTAIAAISSTGLAVTGTLSATSGLGLSNGNSLSFGGAGSDTYISGSAATDYIEFVTGAAQRALLNNTGLAVTGALSATGTIQGSKEFLTIGAASVTTAASGRFEYAGSNISRVVCVGANSTTYGEFDVLVQKSDGTNASVAAFTSTGLAVTGTLSASTSISAGTGSPPVAGLINSVGTVGFATSDNVNSSLYIRNGSGGTIIGTDAGGVLRLAANGSTSSQVVGTFSSTGLAVTGTLSSTGILTVGDATSISRIKQSCLGTAGNMAYTSYLVGTTQYGAIGLSGALLGTTATDFAIFAETGKNVQIMANGSTTAVGTFSSTGLAVTGQITATYNDIGGIVITGSSANATSLKIVNSHYSSGNYWNIANDSLGGLTLNRNGTDLFYIGRSGNTAAYFAGNLSVAGALSKGSGSFRIEHPLPEKSATHQLVHSFIEGPQADLIYRGKVVLVDGKASVNIDAAATMTDGTFEVLCRDVQCFTTNETGWTAVRGKVTGNILTIEAKDADCTDEISWMVIGERQDPHMMETDWTDDNGKVIVEPLKPAALESK